MSKLDVQFFQRQGIPMDMSFNCQSGEMIALVGPSGSGKTSALRALAGLLPVQVGFIRLGDDTWFDSLKGIDLPTKDREVGMVFQNYALFPHLSALQNICLARPQEDARSYAENMMRDMGLLDLLHRYPHELSGGQRQRVALARAFARNPKILLLDEAFSAVDYPTRKSLYEELIKLRERISIPIVMVTHDLREARLLCDRMCILDQGKTLQQASPEKVLSSPRNERVAALVGLNDIYSGTFHQGSNGHARLQWGHGPQAITLEILDKGRLPSQTEVRWVISKEYVQLHQERTDQENTFEAKIEAIKQLGEVSVVSLCIPVDQLYSMHLELSTRLIRDLQMIAGQSIWISLEKRGIHIMPVYSDPRQKELEKNRRHAPSKLSVILLVAGAGARLGNIPKVLMRLGSKTLLEWHLETLERIGVEQIIVVTGHYHEQIEKYLSNSKIQLVQNTSLEKGQAHSVRLGIETLQQLDNDSDMVMMMLGDQPLLDEADLRQLVERFKVRSYGEFVIPKVMGERGNPIVMSRKGFESILKAGPDMTVRSYMDLHPELVESWETGNPHFTFDIDTQEDVVQFEQQTGLKIELPNME